MNLNMDNYTSVIKTLGIVMFVLTACFPINIYLYFYTREREPCVFMDSLDDENNICTICFGIIILGILWIYSRISCALCFMGDFHLKRFAFMICLIFSPIFIISIIILVFILIQKSEYNDYLSMEFIEDFLDRNIYDSLIINYNRDIIVLIFTMSIYIIYAISLFLIFIISFNKKDNIVNYNNNHNGNDNDIYEKPYYEVGEN